MALTATILRLHVTLSDVDRGVYETLDLRLAQHPSESARYLVTRLLAYCLSYEEGIAFSKEGIASTEEAPISVRDRTGQLLAFFDIGAPSAERLHRAAKSAPRVAVFTHTDLSLLRKEAASRAIHRLDEIEVWRFEPAFLDQVWGLLDRTTKLELVRNEGQLYVTVGTRAVEGQITRGSLVAPTD
jgi:uncharacterized protein YaeQ